MKVKIIIYIVFIFLCAILQTTIFEDIKFYSVNSNIFLVLIITISLMRSRLEVLIISFISGIVYDILVGKYIGLSSIIFMILILGIYKLDTGVHKESRAIQIILIIIGTIVFNSLVYIFASNAVGFIEYFHKFKSLIIPELLYNIMIGLIIYKPILNTSRFIDNSVDIVRRRWYIIIHKIFL